MVSDSSLLWVCICTNIIPVNLSRNLNLWLYQGPHSPLGHVALGCIIAILSRYRVFVAGWSQHQWRGFERAEAYLRRCCEVAQRYPREMNPRPPVTVLLREMQVGRWNFWIFAWWEMTSLDNFANLSMKLVLPSSLTSSMPYKSLLQTILHCYSDIAWACIPLLLDLGRPPGFGFKTTCILALAGTASLSLDRWVKQHCLSCPYVLGMKVLSLNKSSWLNIQINVLSH